LSKNIIEHFGIKYKVTIQYKGGYIIEINPRLSTFIYTDTWNESWIIFDYPLGNKDIDVLSKSLKKILVVFVWLGILINYFINSVIDMEDV
tara:strand:- start:336 stop:608 length:273 start_codon:yes stop_codon:yes gene_type:complete